MRFTVLLPRGDRVPATLERAVRWYADVSNGVAQLQPDVVRVDAPPSGWGELACARWPAEAGRARDAAAEVVAGLPVGSRARIRESVLLALPLRGVHPHTWRFRHGGVHLGGRRWCRTYALLARDAPFSAVVHELGHLLFGWPDHPPSSGIGFDCLMATGALVADDREPAWPCAPLRVGAGWVTPAALSATLRVRDLARGEVFAHRDLLVERRDDRVVAFAREPLRVAGRVPADGGTRPVLSVLADFATREVVV